MTRLTDDRRAAIARRHAEAERAAQPYSVLGQFRYHAFEDMGLLLAEVDALRAERDAAEQNYFDAMNLLTESERDNKRLNMETADTANHERFTLAERLADECMWLPAMHRAWDGCGAAGCEHSSTGRRAWCSSCSEWCYPTIPCIRGELEAARAEVDALRAERDAARAELRHQANALRAEVESLTAERDAATTAMEAPWPRRCPVADEVEDLKARLAAAEARIAAALAIEWADVPYEASGETWEAGAEDALDSVRRALSGEEGPQ